jgi:hypothetical protein
MQAKLAAASGVAPQLKRRPERKDGLQTWMEIYPVVGEGFAEQAGRCRRRGGLLALTAARAAPEVFMDLPHVPDRFCLESQSARPADCRRQPRRIL